MVFNPQKAADDQFGREKNSMTNDLEAGVTSENGMSYTLNEEARMAILHANALAAYVDAELKSTTIFPSQVDGEEYEVIVRKKGESSQRGLFP